MNTPNRIPGFDRLVAHVPELRSRAAPLIGLVALAIFVAVTAGFIGLDGRGPVWAALGELGAIALAFVWVGQLFWWRNTYRETWGDIAYRNALALHVLPGVPVILAAIVHIGYMPGPFIAFGWAGPVASLLALLLTVSGVALWIRSAVAFGVDNLVLLYVYYPHEGRLVDSSIYSIIRHPVYSAAVQVCLALGLWRGTWLSVAFGLFAPVGIRFWLRLVEEPELIERFGDSYLEYRRTVPALYPRVPDLGKYLRFLVTGG